MRTKAPYCAPNNIKHISHKDDCYTVTFTSGEVTTYTYPQEKDKPVKTSIKEEKDD